MSECFRAQSSMKGFTRIPTNSLDYRPRDYFGHYDLEAQLMTRVKGRARRTAIRNALRTGEEAHLSEFETRTELTAEERAAFGGLHPWCMGGEYLPRLKENEIEIARISINSTTFDVTAVYARRSGERIRYRVVDEYEDETLSARRERTSIRPLTMGQLIDFFIGAWDLCGCLEANFESNLNGMLEFFNAESEFYPDLDGSLRDIVAERFTTTADNGGDE